MSNIHLIYFGKENQNLYRLNQADIIESFQSIREDLGKLYKGVYFLELIDSMVLEGHQDQRIYFLLQQTLSVLKSQKDLNPLIRLFEIRLLSLSGYKPQLDHCVICKMVSVNGIFKFSFFQNGILCTNCSRKIVADIKFTTGTRNYIKKLMEVEIKSCGRIKFTNNQAEEIEKVTHRLILSQLGRETKSYPFIKNMGQFI